MKKLFETIEAAYGHVRTLGYTSRDEDEIVEETQSIKDITCFGVKDRRPDGIYITAEIRKDLCNYSILLDVPMEEVVSGNEC